MKKRIISVMLAGILALSMGACGSKGASNNGTGESGESKEIKLEENKMPIADGDVELSIYTFFQPGAQQVYKDLSEHPVVKQIEEETGLKLTFVHPPQGDDGTFFNTMIASGELPDIIYGNFASYPGGSEGAIEDGILLNINDLVAQYGYYYDKLLSSFPDEKRELIERKSTSDNGNLVGFCSIIQPDYLENRINVGMVIRKDLLEKYGMEMPVTLDDYEEYFKKCQEDGIKTPLAMTQVTDFDWKNQNMFASAFGVTHNGFYLDADNQVKYSRMQPEYKEYLELLNDWYQKGYLTSDFLSATKQDVQKSFESGDAGMTVGGCWEIMKINTVGQELDPNFAAIGVPYPRLNENDELNYATVLESINGLSYHISASCEHPVEAIKFLDYLYSDECRELCAWGPGNEEYPTYTEVDGKKEMTEFMTNNPEFDFATARDRYTLSNFQVMWDEEMEKQQYEPYPEKLETWENWAYNTSSNNRFPTMATPTIEEATTLSDIMNSINTYTDEMILKFITGNEPLEKFDDFVANIESMNIEQALEIEQAAADRYFER